MKSIFAFIIFIFVFGNIFAQKECDCEKERQRAIISGVSKAEYADYLLLSQSYLPGIDNNAPGANLGWTGIEWFSTQAECNSWIRNNTNNGCKTIPINKDLSKYGLGSVSGSYSKCYKCIYCPSGKSSGTTTASSTLSDDGSINGWHPGSDIFEGTKVTGEGLLARTQDPPAPHITPPGSTMINVNDKTGVQEPKDSSIDFGNEDEDTNTDMDISMEIIGSYIGKPVYKKGDTIIVTANNKRYLLSKQTLLDNKNTYGDYHAVVGVGNGIIPEDGWYLGIDLNGNNNVIGYITTTSQRSNSTAFGEMERFAKNAVNCKFNEITCDKTIENKFKLFCDWQICKMTNTANVFNLSYSDYKKMIDDDIDLNNRIIALKAKDIIVQVLNYKVGEKTGNTVDLNTSVSDFVYSGIINAINGNLEGDLGNCVVSIKNYVNITMQNKAPDDLRNKTLAQLFETKDEQLKNRYTSEMGILLTDIWHGAYDVVSSCAGEKAAKELLVYNMLPELSGITAIGAANLTINYSIAPEYKRSIKTFIDNSVAKKAFLEKYRQEYINKFNATKNCLEYNKVISDLSTGNTGVTTDLYTTEAIVPLMKDYVFGNKEIPKCNILSASQLTNKPTIQPTAQVSTENKYDLKNAIRSKRGNKTRYYIFENDKCTGWVDETGGNQTFLPNKGLIEGLNLFGSIYIGPNNPANPDGTPNFDLPPQDAIDAAAKEHDKCYDSKGAKGVSGALWNTKVTDCDENLVTACSFYIPDGSLTDKINNFTESVAKWSYNPDLKTRATLVAAGFSNIFLTKYPRKFINNQIESAFEKVLIGKNTYKITFSKTTSIPSVSGATYDVEAGDYYIDSETKMQNGKIVSGKIYDKEGNVKHLIFLQRNF